MFIMDQTHFHLINQLYDKYRKVLFVYCPG